MVRVLRDFGQAITRFFRGAGSLVDLRDVHYYGGVGIAAVGASHFHPGAGLLAAGVGLAWVSVRHDLERLRR